MKPKKTIKELESQLYQDSENLVLRLKLGTLYLDVGRTDKALELYRSVILTYRAQGRLAQAIAACKSMLEIEPSHQETLVLLADLHQQQAEQMPQDLAAAAPLAQDLQITQPMATDRSPEAARQSDLDLQPTNPGVQEVLEAKTEPHTKPVPPPGSPRAPVRTGTLRLGRQTQPLPDPPLEETVHWGQLAPSGFQFEEPKNRSNPPARPGSNPPWSPSPRQPTPLPVPDIGEQIPGMRAPEPPPLAPVPEIPEIPEIPELDPPLPETGDRSSAAKPPEPPPLAPLPEYDELVHRVAEQQPGPPLPPPPSLPTRPGGPLKARGRTPAALQTDDDVPTLVSAGPSREREKSTDSFEEQREGLPTAVHRRPRLRHNTGADSSAPDDVHSRKTSPMRTRLPAPTPTAPTQELTDPNHNEPTFDTMESINSLDLHLIEELSPLADMGDEEEWNEEKTHVRSSTEGDRRPPLWTDEEATKTGGDDDEDDHTADDDNTADHDPVGVDDHTNVDDWGSVPLVYDHGLAFTSEALGSEGLAPDSPLSFFGHLPTEALAEMARRIQRRNVKAGRFILREGNPSEACFVIARGSVRVLKKDPINPMGDLLEVARLRGGELFGEFALLAERRRQATVQAVEDSQLYLIPRKLLRELAATFPEVGPMLEAFYRERLLTTLLRRAPFFQSLPDERRAALRARFGTLRSESGQAIVREGQPAGGLYVIVLGSIEITKRVSTKRRALLTTLGEGTYFGEMSLLNSGLARATATTQGPTELAILPPAHFYNIAASDPKVWQQMRSTPWLSQLKDSQIVTGETCVV